MDILQLYKPKIHGNSRLFPPILNSFFKFFKLCFHETDFSHDNDVIICYNTKQNVRYRPDIRSDRDIRDIIETSIFDCDFPIYYFLNHSNDNIMLKNASPTVLCCVKNPQKHPFITVKFFSVFLVLSATRYSLNIQISYIQYSHIQYSILTS